MVKWERYAVKSCFCCSLNSACMTITIIELMFTVFLIPTVVIIRYCIHLMTVFYALDESKDMKKRIEKLRAVVIGQYVAAWFLGITSLSLLLTLAIIGLEVETWSVFLLIMIPLMSVWFVWKSVYALLLYSYLLELRQQDGLLNNTSVHV